MARKNAEIAVHSLKDLPATTPAPFTLAAILKRHSPFDIMIFKPEYWHQMDLSSNPQAHLTREALARLGPLKIATGSLRRSSLLREASPAIQAIPIRGNVDTRLKSL
ncbi:MAG: hypothetical protein R3B45_13815 [Bdellovibrionota bacterium]